MPSTISDLERIVSGLGPEARRRFERLYGVAVSTAEVRPPESMHSFIFKHFKYLSSEPPDTPAWREEILAAVRRQRVVHVLNRVTGEATLFNHIRAMRPQEVRDAADLEAEIERARPTCDFCRPLERTPENAFGRVGDRTCANIAAYDGWHGLVLFQEHSPLEFRHESFAARQVADLLATSRQWAEKARAADAEARYFFLMWNCLAKAGASIVHGHAQMTVGRRFHYGKVDRLRRAAGAYAAEHGTGYFEDLARVHEDLGLAVRWGQVRAMAHLTPIKEKEIVLLCGAYEAPDTAEAVYRALKVYAALDVKAFNLVVYAAPLGRPDPAWEGFPVLVYLVDRGDPAARTTDIGGMEMYASSVVSSDPFQVAAALGR